MPLDISYYSECDIEYVKAIKTCKTLEELKLIVTEYRQLAEDAFLVVQKMDNSHFDQFCKGRNRTKPSLKWMEMYGAVLLPKLVLEIGLIASEFHVPFGVAYHRISELRKGGEG